MKWNIMIRVLIAGVLVVSAGAQDNIGPQQPADNIIAASPGDSSIPAIVNAQPQAPLGTSDLLQAYRQGMALVFQKTCEELEQIAQAVHNGSMSREQAEYSSLERYEVGMMTFQLLHALHQSAEYELQRAAKAQEEAEFRVYDDTVLVVPPLSVDVSPQIARYLELNPAQIAAIQAQLADHRNATQPLVERLAKSQRALSSAALKGSHDSKEIRALAGEESRIVEQLLLAKAQFETRLYSILTSEQQQKIDSIRASTQP